MTELSPPGRIRCWFRLLNLRVASCTPCASRNDIGSLLRYIQPFLNHGNQYYRNGKLVISTFAGQESKFGDHTFEDGWTHAKRVLEESTPVGGRCFWSRVIVDPQATIDLFYPVVFHRSRKIPLASVLGWVFQCALTVP